MHTTTKHKLRRLMSTKVDLDPYNLDDVEEFNSNHLINT